MHRTGETGTARGDEALSTRPASTADLAILYEISQQCFESEPWTLDGLQEEITRDSALCEVAESGSAGLVGFLVAWRVLDELHLLRIATRPDWRRRGVGGRLLDRLLEVAVEEAASVCYLEVRASNRTARALYEKRGFKIVGVRKAYYANPGEDAVVMAWTQEG